MKQNITKIQLKSENNIQALYSLFGQLQRKSKQIFKTALTVFIFCSLMLWYH
jgi:hypothetical protein